MPYTREETYTIVKRNPKLGDYVRGVSLATPKKRPPDMPDHIYPVGVVRTLDDQNNSVLVMFYSKPTFRNNKVYLMNEHPSSFFIVKKAEESETKLKDDNPNMAFKRSLINFKS